jgi:hypothetical protein
MDDDGRSHWIDLRTGRPAPPPEPGDYRWGDLDWVWNEERLQALLAADDDRDLIVAGTSQNQGKFYPYFNDIVLLSAPVEVIMDRLNRRASNPYGTTPRTQARVLEHIETVEPLLRAGAGHEIDTNRPLADVVGQVLELLHR